MEEFHVYEEDGGCVPDDEDFVHGNDAEDDDEEELVLTAEQLEEKRQQNIKSLLLNDLQISRKPLLSGGLINVRNPEVVLRQQFRCPHPDISDGQSNALRKRLLARKRFVPWAGGRHDKMFVARISPKVPSPPSAEEEKAAAEEALPEGIEPLVLWRPPEGSGGPPVEVDTMLVRWLRPHQREGVAFMFECVAGIRDFEGSGCILADDMGLGKTLQGISLLWTLLRNGHPLLGCPGGAPLARRCIIVCPTSLVSNWDSECSKWLKGRVRTLPLAESSRDDVIRSISQFLAPQNYFQVLIVSYETFRLHAERLRASHACDLLICDEAHRLKNDATLTNKALDSLPCKRRVLLSGTPLQNHLDEFYAMVNFCNPGVLGSPSEFRKTYENPILAGREPGASDSEQTLGVERSEQLSSIVNNFILRRTNNLLSQHLPPKLVITVCCKMTAMQRQLYCHFLQSAALRSVMSSDTTRKSTSVLSSITSLKKLCNHPKLIYDAVHSSKANGDTAIGGFEGCAQYFPPGLFDNGRPGRGGMPCGWEHLSGKFAVLARMLELLHEHTNDRIVIVSNYTQTLDLFMALCRERGYPCLRLDGTTSISKRQKLVVQFNDQTQNQFVFLLSSKAGGCGLNLIGGNRLVLFDPDWNPANDKQAAARVWRDGQNKQVYLYRFLTTGSIEEKVYQRQLAKEGLQSLVNNQGGGGGGNVMSVEELRDLFTLQQDSLSDTYDSMVCNAGKADSDDEGGEGAGRPPRPVVDWDAPPDSRPPICTQQIGKPKEEDLAAWGHHSRTSTVNDAILQRVGDEHVTFCFTCAVDGKELEQLPPAPTHRHSAPAIGGGGRLQQRGGGGGLEHGGRKALARQPLSMPPPQQQRPTVTGAKPAAGGALHNLVPPKGARSVAVPPSQQQQQQQQRQAATGAATAADRPCAPARKPPVSAPAVGAASRPPLRDLPPNAAVGLATLAAAAASSTPEHATASAGNKRQRGQGGASGAGPNRAPPLPPPPPPFQTHMDDSGDDDDFQ